VEALPVSSDKNTVTIDNQNQNQNIPDKDSNKINTNSPPVTQTPNNSSQQPIDGNIKSNQLDNQNKVESEAKSNTDLANHLAGTAFMGSNSSMNPDNKQAETRTNNTDSQNTNQNNQNNNPDSQNNNHNKPSSTTQNHANSDTNEEKGST